MATGSDKGNSKVALLRKSLSFRPSAFVSGAHALRQRFANSKRSLSDSCQDITSTTTSTVASVDCEIVLAQASNWHFDSTEPGDLEIGENSAIAAVSGTGETESEPECEDAAKAVNLLDAEDDDGCVGGVDGDERTPLDYDQVDVGGDFILPDHLKQLPWKRDAEIQCELYEDRKESVESIVSWRHRTNTTCVNMTAACKMTTPESNVRLPPPHPLIRSESVAAQSGCLSGLMDRRARLRLVHQLSVDETRSPGNRAAAVAAAAAATATAPLAPTPTPSPTASPPPPLHIPLSFNENSPSEAGPVPCAEPHSPAAEESSAERRRKRLLRKQTNSAPDSLEDTSGPFTDRLCVSYYLDNVMTSKVRNAGTNGRHSWQGGTANNQSPTDRPQGDNLLKVGPELPSGFRGKRDNLRDGIPQLYMNLPSPNVQNADNESDVFRQLSIFGETCDGDKEEVEAQGPPAASLTRRRALVPPKLMSDAYESSNEDTGPTSSHSTTNGSTESLSSRKRRSSIVVIPPMQICPGDLLVYSKVLTQRTNLLDLDGSTQSLSANDDSGRKSKNTWSLLRLFDRSNRTKSESLCGLEDVLGSIRPSEFRDEQLSRYKGMLWQDFLELVQDPQTSPDFLGGLACHVITPRVQPLLSLSPTHHGTGTLTSGYNSFCQQNNLQQQQQQQQTSPGSTVPQTRQEQAVQTVSRNELKRREAVWDLFQCECTFLYDHLMVLKNVFMEPLKKIQVEGFAMFAEPEVLFGNLDELCCVTYSFCKEFIHLILHNMINGDLQTIEVLVKLFQKSNKALSLSRAYHRYALNYINALNYLETLRRQMEFNEFEKWCSRDARCKKLQLTDLLVAPVQHIMKVPLIIKDIETRTEDARDREIVSQILETEENSLRELDDKMKWLKNFERLLEIQRNIIWPSVLDLDPKTFIPDFLKGVLLRQPCERLIVSPRRQIMLEGPLHLIDAGKATEMFVILFDDMLLITRRKKGLHKKKSSITENWPSPCSRGGSGVSDGALRYVVHKQPLSLDRFLLHDVNIQDATANRLDNAFVLVNLNRFQQIVAVYTFQAPTEQTKNTWIAKLKESQDRWKRTLQNTVFAAQRLGGLSNLK